MRTRKLTAAYLALPVDAYYEMTTWGQANDAWIECAQELGQAGALPGFGGRGACPPGYRCLVRGFGHGRRQSLARCPPGESHGFVAPHQAHSHFWVGLRGGSCRNRPRCGLRARLSPSRCRAAFRGTLFADSPERRCLHGQPDFLGVVWRWRRRRHRDGLGKKLSGGGNSGYAIRLLSADGTHHGLGYFRKGFPDCALTRRCRN